MWNDSTFGSQRILSHMNLDSVLHPEDRVFVVQHGESVSRGASRSGAAKLRETISALSRRRVALPTQRVGSIVAALVASQSVGCDLLLLRDQYPCDDPVRKSWKVSVVLDEELSVAHTYPWRACDCRPNVLLTTSGTTGKPKVALWLLSALLGRVSQCRVEHRIARLAGLGIRKSRYCGRKKTCFQIVMAAVMANLSLVVGFCRRQAQDGAGVAEKAAAELANCFFAPVLTLWDRSFGWARPVRV